MEALIKHHNVRTMEFFKNTDKKYKTIIVIRDQSGNKHWYRLTLHPVKVSLDTTCLKHVSTWVFTVSRDPGFESYGIVFRRVVDVFLKIKYLWDGNSLKTRVEISCNPM